MSYPFEGSNVPWPEVVTLPDDSNLPNQANFSPGWEQSLNRTQHLSIRRMGSLYFPQGQTLWGFTTTTSTPSWDAGNGRWFVGASGSLMKQSFDGFLWTNIGGALSANATAVFSNPLGNTGVVKSSNDTMANLIIASDTWHEYTGATWDPAGTPEGIWFAGGDCFLAWEARPLAQMRIYQSFDTLPSAWNPNQGAQFPTGFLNNGSTKYKMFTAQNSTRILFFTSQPGISQYVYTNDGATYVQAAMPITLTGSQEVTGCAYDSQRAQFVLFIATTGGVGTGFTTMYTSQSGAAGTWTAAMPAFPLPLSQGLTALNYNGVCLLVSQFWVRQLYFRMVYSVDGGVSWQLTKMAPVPGTGFVYSGDTQALYVDATNFATSDMIGPPATLAFDGH